MNKIVEYVIGAKDATGDAIKSALSRIKSFAASVGGNLQNIRAGFGMLATAASKAGQFLAKAFAFEKMTVQFKTLVGNMDEARAHMAMLQELGDTPPFSMEQFAAASRALMVMSDGALGFRKSLELVGDAAAATGQPIESLAHEVGRAYAIIRDGQPLTRATMALRNMGVLTPEVAQKLQDLQDSGASTTVIWGEMETALKRYKGAMEETEKTADGLMGAISSQWDDTLREFGAACLETGKDALGGLLDWMKQLREDGSISAWAESFGQSVGTVAEKCKEAVEAIKTIGEGVQWLYEKTGISDIVHGANSIVQGAGAAIGAAWGGGSWEDIANAYNDASQEEINKGYYGNKLARSGAFGDRAQAMAEADEQNEKDKEAKVEQARQAGVERAKQAAVDKAKKEKEEEEKKQKALEEGQRKIDERRAKEKAKADAEAAKQAAEEKAKLQLAREKEIAAEIKRMWKQDLAEKTAAEKAANAANATAQDGLAIATAKEQQAWGWFRDKDSLRAQLEEEQNNAKAETDFEKQFAKLKSRRYDWRTANDYGSGGMHALSLDETAVKRVALAREEKEAAAKYAQQTAEASQRCAEMLEQIQGQFEGCE